MAKIRNLARVGESEKAGAGLANLAPLTGTFLGRIGDGNDMHLVLITGPAGVGKSTLSWEMSAQLPLRKSLMRPLKPMNWTGYFRAPRSRTSTESSLARPTSAVSTWLRCGRLIMPWAIHA